jgi:hypothetical protein
MELQEFSRKVAIAAETLWQLCQTGEPEERQVIYATKEAGLLVSFEEESFVGDPVRLAVFIKAYHPAMRPGVTIEQVIERACRWQTEFGPVAA